MHVLLLLGLSFLSFIPPEDTSDPSAGFIVTHLESWNVTLEMLREILIYALRMQMCKAIDLALM